MNQQLQAMAVGLEAVQNKVSYMESKDEDSDFDLVTQDEVEELETEVAMPGSAGALVEGGYTHARRVNPERSTRGRHRQDPYQK